MSGVINDFVIVPPPTPVQPPPAPVEPAPVAAAPQPQIPQVVENTVAAPINDFVIAAPAAPPVTPPPMAPTPMPAASLSSTVVGAPPPEDTGEGFLSGIFAGNRAAGREMRRTLSGQAFELDPNAPVQPEHRTWLNEFGYGFGHGAPVIGAGLVGGAVGAAAGSAVPVVGTGIGGAVGAGLGVAGMSLAQELAPAYAQARAQGMDHDAAVDYAWTRGGATGAVSGLFGMIPGGKTIIGNLLLQAGVLQPVSGAATRTVVPLVTGDPLPTTEEYIRGLGQDVASGAAFAGGHAAARGVNRLAMGREAAPTAPPPPLPPEVQPAETVPVRPVEVSPVAGQEPPLGERTRFTIDEPVGAPDVEVTPVPGRPAEPVGVPEPGAVPGGRLEPTEPGTAPVGRGPEVLGDAATGRPGQEPPLGETGAPVVEPVAPTRPGEPAPVEGARPAAAGPAEPLPVAEPTAAPRFRTEPDDAHPGQHVAKDESGAVVGKGATPDEAAGDALRRGGQPYPPEQPAAASDADRAAKLARLKQIGEELRPLIEKQDLTAEEARRYEELTKEGSGLRFETARPLTRDRVVADEKSTLSPDVVVAAHSDLHSNRAGYDAIHSAAAGAHFDAETAVDRVMTGNDPNISAADLYRQFDATRAALRAQYGDTIPLFRAEGQQRQKATTNWATTRAFAEQFGRNIVERQVPVENIIAVNVAGRGRYHELIVGEPPRETTGALVAERPVVAEPGGVAARGDETVPVRPGDVGTTEGRPATVDETVAAPVTEARPAEAPAAPAPRAEVPGAAPRVPEGAPAPSPQLTNLRATRDRMEANPNLSFRESLKLNQIKAQIQALERTEARAARVQQRTQERAMRAARSQAEAQAAARGDTSGPRIGGIKRPYREPETGRKPDFYGYQYADGTSVYRSVFDEAGHDPDVATNWPVQRQNEVLSNHLKNKFGYSSVDIVGARGQPASQVDQRMARDFMLDLTRATTDMFAALNYPLDAASLGGRLRLEFVPEGKTSWLGQYAWGSSGKVIRVQSGANSYGHEWTHALDHQLTERYTQDPAELMKLLTMQARDGSPPLNVKDPVQAGLARVINAMFFDKQAMAVRQLALENTALKVGPNGQPTAAAMTARRQLGLLEAGGSLLHMQPTEFRVKSASLGDPAYWASAHEMLARAHEAYIARQMQQAGVNPRGVVMPDAAYIETTNRMLANAYPKDAERIEIFKAFDELHRALRNEQVLGSGPPAKWADYGVSDPHYWPVTAPQTKGNALTRPIRREIESYRDFTKGALQAWPFDPDRPKGPLSLSTQLADAFRSVAYSARGLMQTFIERAPPGAQPHLQKVLDLLTTDPATGRYTPENFEEAWKSYSREWHRREGNILQANGLNPERMSVEQGLMLRHVMTEADPRQYPVDVADPSKGFKPIPANIVKAGGDMRFLMEDIWSTMHRAGFDIGYAKNGYYPRMYDVYKVFDNPAGFDAQARELHRLMFDREVAHDPANMVEQWTQLSGPNRKQAPPGISAEIGRLRQNLRRQAELEGNPARTPAEDAELVRLKTDADTIAQGIHDPLGDHVAALAAAEWYGRFMNGGVHDFDAMGPSANFMRARSLPPEADRIMRDFMYADPRVALPQYFQSAARRLAFGERFGTKGEELQRLLDEARSAPGANPFDIAEFESYANLVMGRMNNHAQTRRSMKIASAVGALGQVALMPRAAWSSLTEPMAANIVTGDMRTGIKIIANQFGQLFKTASALERTQLAEYLGVTTSAMHDSVMLSRNNADYSNTPAINRLLTHFYRITGLTQLTNSQRVGTTASASWYLGKIAHDYLGQGVGTRARNARDDATRWLNELGVKESNHQEFAQWMAGLNGALPSIARLQTDPMGSVYGLAVRRMVDRIIQDPTKADRPAISHGAFGSLVAQLMNFNYSFQKNVLSPMFMNIEHAYGRAKVNAVAQGAGTIGATTAGLVAGAGAVSHAAAMAGSVLAASFMTTMLRQYLFAPDQWAAHEEKDDLEDWLLGLAFARSGFNGTLDPLIQVASNLRYNSDLTDLVDGATLRWASQNAMDVIAPFIRDNESPNSNTQYYNQAKGAFNLIGVPLAATGLSMLGAAGGPLTRLAAGAALQFGTSPGAAGGFAGALAGDKGTKLPKETEGLGALPDLGNLGDLGDLSKADKDAEEAGGMVTPWGLIDDMIAPAWRYTAPWVTKLGTKTKIGALAAGAGYGVYDYLEKTEPYREASEAARP